MIICRPTNPSQTPQLKKRAFESMYTLTPSCSTFSSNLPGSVTYSKLYVNPEHPLFCTPILINCGSGWSNKSFKCSTALELKVINAFLGRNVLFCFVFFTGFSDSVIFGVVGSTVAVDIILGCVDFSVSVFFVSSLVFFVSAVSGLLMFFNVLLENLDARDLLAGTEVLWSLVDTFSFEPNECLDHLELKSLDSLDDSPKFVFIGYFNPE
mmetsp:Transcript_37/g.55  ORF Transcript_37/g.55 Transcript_37/m.55 type:complete len:210 (+) Transcript_37:259-888(+)